MGLPDVVKAVTSDRFQQAVVGALGGAVVDNLARQALLSAAPQAVKAVPALDAGLAIGALAVSQTPRGRRYGTALLSAAAICAAAAIDGVLNLMGIDLV